MKEQDLRKQFSNNLVYYRKACQMTQLELATLLNYSDKAVSKWERGESLPDVYTLTEIARVVGVTPNDLLSERIKAVKHPKDTLAKIIISALSVVLVWVVATIVFAILQFVLKEATFKNWLVFIYAIPISAILLIIFSAIWKNILFTFLSASVCLWSCALSTYLTISTYVTLNSMELFFIICIPIQVLFLLWYLFQYNKKKKKEKARKRFFVQKNEA